MESCAVRGPRRLCAALAVLAALVAFPVPPAATGGGRASDEVRALWVARTTLASQASIERMVDSARASGFNTLLVQVRGRGDAYYASSIEPRADALAGQPPRFDPLQATLTLAHAAGLRVHAWVNVNLVSNANELPADRTHIVHRHPEWLMVPRAIAREMLLLDPTSRLYADKLARWTRGRLSEVEGLYLSPVSEDAARYAVAIVEDLASRYAVDGIHFDYVRYPNVEFDYSGEALGRFKAEVDRTLEAPERARYERLLRTSPFAYADAFPDRWRAFRRDSLTMLVSQLRAAVLSSRPKAVVTAAVLPNAVEASERKLQDWRTWLDRGLIDIACPMAYASDPATFTAQLTTARDVAGERPVWAGIGAYRLSSTQTIESIRIARRLGAAGVILFSYDSMAAGPKGTRYLSEVGQAVFVR